MRDGQGQPTQIDDATELVRQAIADDPQHQPVILTFVHGWKHNASPGPPEEDTNVQGVEEVLNYLYEDFYGPKEATSTQPAYAGHVVLGIYIAWRGDSVSQYWPVQRTFSVYNRESAAMRVGGAAVADTLMRISQIAHPPGSQNDPHQPFLIFVGHSFGALVLERAIVPAFTQLLDRQRDNTDLQKLPTLADLVIYINSAAAATEAKPMLDYLAARGVEYQVPAVPNGRPAIDHPLFLAVSSTADTPVGILLPIEHRGSGIFYKLAGSFRAVDPLSCFNPHAAAGQRTHWVDADHSQQDFWNTAAGHMDVLQSHELKEFIPIHPGPIRACPAAASDPRVYGMYTVFAPAETVPRSISRCYQIERKYLDSPSQTPCNGTPYWVLSTDKNIIPDHGTIFTGRLVSLIGKFLPRPGETATLTSDQTRLATARAEKAAHNP